MNFSDTIQHWLQGQINAAVDGHSARLERLEAAVTHAQYQDERIKRLEAQVFELNERLLTFQERYPDFPGLSSHVEHLNQLGSELLKRVTKLDQAYSDMATMKDLQKDTRPEVLMDKLHSAIVRLLKDFLQEYVKEVDLDGNIEAILDRRLDSLIGEDCVKEVHLEENVEAILDCRSQASDDDKRDAQRYRWLREQHWSDNVVGIVRHPGEVLKTGTVCYSDASLDRLIDEALAKEQV